MRLPITNLVKRAMSTAARTGSGFRVSVLGANGGIGQPLSLLLKTSPLVGDLRLYDLVGTPGLAADVSHVDTSAAVSGFVGKSEGQGQESLDQALDQAQVVVIPAGVPRKPGMTRDDLFQINAGILQTLARRIAVVCPDAVVCVISNPVNSLVPIVATTLEQHGVYNPRKVLGVTTLDVCRTRTFVGQKLGRDPATVDATVIGGHAGTTILPLLSQIAGMSAVSPTDLKALIKRIQFGGDEVVAAKAGKGSATLSMAYAGSKCVTSILRAMGGEDDVVECAYVENDLTSARFFAAPCVLAKTGGIAKVKAFGSLSKTEEANMEEMLPTLRAQIQKGVDFAKEKK